MKKLADKVAIVTGAGQGVGLGIARRFAAEGANLMITGRTEQKLKDAVSALSDLGAEVEYRVLDVGKRADADEAVRTAVDAFGRLDVLVNNAQSFYPNVMLEDLDDGIWCSTIESGLYGTLYHMQAALPHLKAAGGGSIINLGSREGISGGAGFAAYSAAKEGIRGLTRTAAREWGKYKIRVNVICPAALTPPAKVYFEEHPELADHYLRDICLDRFGDPETDIGPAAVFLASDDGRYVTGQTLNVDGGQVML